MEHDYTELVIGYLQGNLSKEETDLFYDWVNESASNKETFFEIKAMYDAGLFLGKPLDTASSWQRLLNKKKNSQSKQKRYEIHRGNVKVSSMDRKLSKDVKLILENRM